MNLVEDEIFNKIVNDYKKLKLEDKKQVLLTEVKELMAVLNYLNGSKNKDGKVLYNREILDIEKKDSSEEDYVEGLFVYIKIIKELLGDYLGEKNE